MRVKQLKSHHLLFLSSSIFRHWLRFLIEVPHTHTHTHKKEKKHTFSRFLLLRRTSSPFSSLSIHFITAYYITLFNYFTWWFQIFLYSLPQLLNLCVCFFIKSMIENLLMLVQWLFNSLFLEKSCVFFSWSHAYNVFDDITVSDDDSKRFRFLWFWSSFGAQERYTKRPFW